MQKNSNLTHLDTDQIVKRKFDESVDADRVVIVGQDFSIDSNKIANAVREGLSGINFNGTQIEAYNKMMIHNNQAQFQTIKENVFIPQLEIKEIEKQVFIPQIEYKTIEIPVITERVVTVDRPVIIREIEIKEIEKQVFIKEPNFPFIMKISAVVQIIGILGLLIYLFKK